MYLFKTFFLKRNIYILIALSAITTLSRCGGQNNDFTIVKRPILVLVNPAFSNNTTPTFTLKNLEPGGKIALYSDESCSIAVQIDIKVTGRTMNLTLSPALINDGTYTYSIKQTNQANNSSECSNVVIYTLDTQVPSSPTFLESGTPIFSQESRPTFSITNLENGTILQFYSDSTCSPSSELLISRNATDISLEADLTSDGMYSFYAKQTDQAGNISTCSSNAISYTLDRQAPSAPTFLASGTPIFSQEPRPTFAMMDLEDGSIVQLYSNSSCSLTSEIEISRNSANIILTSDLSSAPTYSFYAKQTDQAGNVSTCSTDTIMYTLDTQLPIAPSFSASGTVIFSKNPQPTFALTDLEDGSTVQLYSNLTCSSSSEISISQSGSDITLDIGSDATYSLYAKQTDKSGNVSACSTSTVTYTLDRQAPTAPIFAETSVFSQNPQPTLAMTNLEDGATTNLYFRSGCSSSSIVAASRSGTNIVVISSLGADAAYSFYANQTDQAGNVSTCSSTPINYTLDSQAPTAPSFTETSVFSQNPQPTFAMTDLEDGSTVTLYSDSTCSSSSERSVSRSAENITLTTDIGSDGSYSLYAKQTDKSGNVSTCSTSTVTYTLDTQLPSAPSFSTSGVPVFSQNPQPTFAMTDLEDGSTVTLYSDSTCSSSSELSTSRSGTNITLTTDIGSDRSYSLYAKQMDQAGNVSTCSTDTLTYTLDRQTPTAPSFTETSVFSQNPQPTFAMTDLEDGSTVTLYSDSACSSNTELSVSRSTENITLTTDIGSDGAYSLYAKQMDQAGNISACSTDTLTYTLDRQSPIAPSFTETSVFSQELRPTFAMTDLESGSTVTLYSDSACSSNTELSVSRSGTNITLTTDIGSDGAYSLYAKQMDQAGNVSTCSTDTLTYTLDRQTPTAPSFTETSVFSQELRPTFAMTDLEDGSTVQLYSNSACSSSSELSISRSGTNITLTTDIGSDATYSLYAKQTDQAGNVSTCSTNTLTYTLDRQAPTPPSFTETSVFSQNPQPTFAMTDLEDGSTVQIYSDSTCSSSSELSVSRSTENITLTTDIGSDATYSLYAKQTDQAGNVSICSTSTVTYTLDRQAPNTPILSLVTPSTSFHTNPTFNLTGLEVGSTIALYSNENCSSSEQQMNITSSDMDITLSSALTTDASYSFSAKQTDQAGNASNCSTNTVSYELDTTLFVSLWRVGVSGYGDEDMSVTLPLSFGFTYDFTVDWGDNQAATVDAYDSVNITHNYTNAGDYIITIKGTVEAWYFNNSGDKNKIIEVQNFGKVAWLNLKNAFHTCEKLEKFIAGSTDTSQVTTMASMFTNSSSLTELDLSSFNTLSTTNMSNMFYNASSLTSLDLSNFNTINTTNMSYMFYNASGLTSLDLSRWTVSNVNNINNMFLDTSSLASINLAGWQLDSVPFTTDPSKGEAALPADEDLTLTCSTGETTFLDRTCDENQ